MKQISLETIYKYNYQTDTFVFIHNCTQWNLHNLISLIE